jgi:hypothetical protein
VCANEREFYVTFVECFFGGLGGRFPTLFSVMCWRQITQNI